MVAPVSINGSQYVVRYYKNIRGQISSEILESCRFVPILNGIER